MASTVWKGYITFGLISIPVRLFAAARGERVSFNQIHAPCNTRIKQQIFCPTCERTIERSEIVKGYAIDKDRYVTVEDDELKKIAPSSTETMEILEFVKLDEIDPLYFDTSYYIVPEDPGKKAYQLLLETMKRTGFAALAKVGMHQREYTVVIRPKAEGLTMHTMYYEDEVRAVPEYGRQTNVELKPQEIQLAEQLVASLASPFEPAKYHDEYQKRVLELIEAKGEGMQVTATPQRKLAPVIDLMAALQKSLNSAEQKKPAGKAAQLSGTAETSKGRKRPTTKAAGG
ncbi:MAG: Ku protein [Bryobacteraceae bacterium]|nr:Ku protein [Bryobacterales bacterium]MEB2362037.1 Ku protein [Bryobacterales bacterium]NUN02883.1 Ku protein [Bryobacteraceae bacterium]